MAEHDRHKPVLPDYVRYMANDSLFGTKEIGEIFGLSKGSIKQGYIKILVNKGILPDPLKLKHTFMQKGRPMNKWTKLEIIEAINKYNKEFFGE